MILSDASTALQMAFLGTTGLLAQTTIPFPDDLKTWPVTAMLVLLVLVSLAMCAYKDKVAGKVAVESAKAATATASAITMVTEKQANAAKDLHDLIQEMRQNNLVNAQIVATLKARPCLGD